MARKPIEKDIDVEKYTFYQMPPRQSLKLLLRIGKIIAPSVANLGELKNLKSVFNSKIDINKVISVLCDRMDVDEVDSIIQDLLSQAICKGKGQVSQNFDEIFGGRLPHLFQVIKVAMEVEYGDFFSGKSGAQD